MTLDDLLTHYRQQFPWNGSFELHQGEQLRARAAGAKVPDEPGVYLVHGYQDNEWKLLYIGRSGTLHNNGTFSDQKLLKRITKGKQEGIPRRRFFREQMEKLSIETLKFDWFVTFADDLRVIPAKAEADLLQAYFDEHNQLPPWNKSI
jgi:hypothetical protein